MNYFRSIMIVLLILINGATLFNMYKTDKQLDKLQKQANDLIYPDIETVFTVCKQGCDFYDVSIAETVISGKMSRGELKGRIVIKHK